ncbi:MAG TPA: hypothetical protein VM427_08475 [Patescibacteria group bacterium]|nr:hypothetical protein [Patescibacteria group bacterium]
MTRSRRSLRIPLLAVALFALVGVIAIPALAAGPSAAPGAAASEKPGRGPKASKAPEVAVTLEGVVSMATDAEGVTTYTIAAAGRIIRLDAGPSWFIGGDHPLAAFVGRSVTITGDQRGDEVDVETVDGTRLRAAGKPPWAGGWKAVGSAHPGWTREKADRRAAHEAAKAARHGAKAGRADKATDADEPAGTPDPNGG